MELYAARGRPRYMNSLLTAILGLATNAATALAVLYTAACRFRAITDVARPGWHVWLLGSIWNGVVVFWALWSIQPTSVVTVPIHYREMNCAKMGYAKFVSRFKIKADTYRTAGFLCVLDHWNESRLIWVTYWLFTCELHRTTII